MAVFLQQKIDNTKDSITIEDLKTIFKIIHNQISQPGRNVFGSCGKIYSLGYTAKYETKDGKSFGEYVKQYIKKKG